VDRDNLAQGGLFAVFHHFGQAPGLAVLYLLLRTDGNQPDEFPEEAEISEAEWMTALHTNSPETVRRTKRLLERHGIFSECKERGGRVRVNHEAIAKLGPAPAPRGGWKKEPQCKPRTVPDQAPDEVVALELPAEVSGSVVSVAITCPAHAHGHTLNCTFSTHGFVDNTEVNCDLPQMETGETKGEVACDLPQMETGETKGEVAELGAVPPAPPPAPDPQLQLGVEFAVPSPPAASPPGVSKQARVPKQAVPDGAPAPSATPTLTGAALQQMIAPLVWETCGCDPDLSLWDEMARRLGSAGNVPELKRRIIEEGQKIKSREKKPALLAAFASQAAKAAHKNADLPPQVPRRGTVTEREWFAAKRARDEWDKKHGT
jgi:hypothetical protein